MNHVDSGDIKVFVQFAGNSILKISLRFWNCVGCGHMRGYFFSQNHPMSISCYALHFDMRNWGYLFDFTSTHAISTPVIFNFRSVFYSELFSAVSGTLKISIKMFQIQRRIFWEWSQNFRRLPTYGFAHAKV